MHMTRRHFLQTSSASALAMTLPSPASNAATSSASIPIAFQLYAVRGEFARAVPETLKTLAQIGYKGVEFWGYAGTPNIYQQYSAAELRKLLDENGLKCCGIHVDLKALAPENFERTMENNRVLGNEYLNLAAAQQKMGSEAGIAELAALLNQSAERGRSLGMKVGYHAHPFDFEKVNGRYAWELLFRRTRPEVNMQMDVGNCLAGHGDPIAMLKEFPGHTWSIHIKEHEDKTFDSDYYREVFRLCETTAHTKWYIVEMGGPDGNGFDIPRQALAKLHRLGK
jgi:sugar phosphate isomerase/epimerase